MLVLLHFQIISLVSCASKETKKEDGTRVESASSEKEVKFGEVKCFERRIDSTFPLINQMIIS